MTLTLTGWLLIVSSIAITALFVVPQQSAKPAFLSRLQSSSRVGGQDLRATARTLIVPAVVFLLVSGIGAATSYMSDPSAATVSGDVISSSSGEDGEIARLKDYTSSIGTEKPTTMAAADKLLPDVNTMIERLAARLVTAPNDVKGWRTLGWSYFNTGRYDQAATAYAKAAELDPSSAEIKASYEEAKAKAAESATKQAAASPETDAVAKTGESGIEKTAKSATVTPHDGGTVSGEAIRAMVDGLAARLESSPRDVEGWTRLMRSRVVLGEKEVAQTACNKALEVFKDDSTASGQITAAAIELGLKAE